MFRFLTAGESHGRALTTIIDGIPSNLKIDKNFIDSHLRRRQFGYGRGLRMKIEFDSVQILSGIRFGKTLGSPISLLIENKDWENWSDKMSVELPDIEVDKITIPRPGHADLTGTIKYNFNDIRNSIERSSARETAARVAAGSVARCFLNEFGIYVGSFVESIGGIFPKDNYLNNLLTNNIPKNFNAWNISKQADKNDIRVLDESQYKKIISKIKKAKKAGDTLGGTFVVIASGLPAGLGSFMQYDRKLNAEISHSIMSINAVKAVEIGAGFTLANNFGSKVHDEITFKNNSLGRKTNYSGGFEGGISTGLPVILRAAMKPIATLMSPIESINLTNFRPVDARRERSDFVAVPACAVIAESMLAISIAKFFLEKFGGDSIEEIKDNYSMYMNNSINRLKNNFKKRKL